MRLCAAPALHSGFSRPACGRWQTCGVAPVRGTRRTDHALRGHPQRAGVKGAGKESPWRSPARVSQPVRRHQERGQGRVKGTGAAREAPPEGPRCRGKAEEAGGRSPSRGCPADGPDQGTRAANGRAIASAGEAGRRQAAPRATKRAGATSAAPKPKVAVSASGTTATARRSTTSTTRRKTATSSATRTPRTGGRFKRRIGRRHWPDLTRLAPLIEPSKGRPRGGRRPRLQLGPSPGGRGRRPPARAARRRVGVPRPR